MTFKVLGENDQWPEVDIEIPISTQLVQEIKTAIDSQGFLTSPMICGEDRQSIVIQVHKRGEDRLLKPCYKVTIAIA